MPFQIRHDGKTYTVNTVVGEGLTKVQFTEDQPQERAEPLEPSDEMQP